MNDHIIKQGDVFLVTDRSGDIPAGASRVLGLFARDTRFLSRFEVDVRDLAMILLASYAGDNSVGTIRLTNRERVEEGRVVVGRESIAMTRERFIESGVLYERIEFKNHNVYPVELEVTVRFAADFLDMFAVRGYQSAARGTFDHPRVEASAVRYAYTGIDGVRRGTSLFFDPVPKTISENEAIFSLLLTPHDTKTISVSVRPESDGHLPPVVDVGEARRRLALAVSEHERQSLAIETDYAALQAMIERAQKDMHSLLTDVGYGPIPVAGLPIYAVPFGRDSLIAAYELLLIDPDIAKRTLRTLAAYQGEKHDPWRDEQPGKIMHELRDGELARAGVVPFRPYYGSIDATLLFIVLAGEVYDWTGDVAFMEALRPSLERALRWIDAYGDRDGDGYVEYWKESEKGISNQGWKDSGDSVVHRDGRLARAPIALVEVQGYVYDAKRRMAKLCRAFGETERAASLEAEAEALRARFMKDFWLPEEAYPAMALDADKQPVATVTSNPGHGLWSGIYPPEAAQKVAERLLQPDVFSGWGIRTMSSAAVAYNPMSYHNGSVWPHDNALILLGMARYGFAQHAHRVIGALIDASRHFEYDRLPELFCGYAREDGPPVPYPVACSPQAWSAGAPLLFVRAMLGLWPDASLGIARVRPSLPEHIRHLAVRRLPLGRGRLDIVLERLPDGTTAVRVERNATGLDIVIG